MSLTRHRSGPLSIGRVILAFSALVSVSLLPGCGSSGSLEVTGPAPLGTHVSSTDCKEWESPPPPGGPGDSNTEDCIVWDYPGGDLLLLTHVNTAFNCCPEFEATVDVVERTILITEHEIEGLCSCLCLFDLGYEIDHLPPDVYQVVVRQEYVPPEENPLEFPMDLVSSPSGSYCSQRAHYPWGI